MSELQSNGQGYRCPCCAEVIKADAIVCRFCGAGLSMQHFQACPYCAEFIGHGAVICRFCERNVSQALGADSGPVSTPKSALNDFAQMDAMSNKHEPPDVLNGVLSGLTQDDPVRSYVDQISHIPTISEQQELELAKREAMGGDVGAIARRELVQSNLAMVVAIAQTYVQKGLPLLDLIHEGNLGLIRATERFNQSLGYKFSAYASLWIHQAIMQALAGKSKACEAAALNTQGEVVLPQGIWQALATLSPKERNVLSLRFGLDDGRQRSLDEVADLMAVSPERIRQTEATLLRKLRSAKRAI